MTNRLDTEAVLAVIEQIYAAGCEPSLWPQVTAMCQAMLPGTGFSLLLNDSANELDMVSCATGYDPNSIADYMNEFHAINPFIPLINALPSDRVARMSELVSREWLLAQPFYHEWLKPSGNFTYGATLPLRSGTSGRLLRLTFDIPSDQPDAEPVAAELLRRIQPHLRRSFEIYWRLRHAGEAASVGQSLLDKLSGASIIVDASGKIVGMNGRAMEMLRQGRILSSNLSNRLSFLAAEGDANFLGALQAATSIDGEGASPSGFVARANGTPHHVVVLPIVCASSIASPQPTRLALVQIAQPDKEGAGAPPAELLRTLYQLTRAEAQVVHRVADGLSIREIAEANETSQSTVRNQLQSAMQKLGVHRQAELVGMLASLTPRLEFSP